MGVSLGEASLLASHLMKMNSKFLFPTALWRTLGILAAAQQAAVVSTA